MGTNSDSGKSTPEENQKLKISISQNFKMEDRDEIKHFLGLKTSQNEDGISVD